MELLMHTAPMMAMAALLLGPITAVPTNAAPNTSGCPPGVQHTETEGGGVGSVDNVTRKAEAGGGGVGSANNATHKAEAEAGGMGSQRSTSATPCVR
jgi:hypothetical protein